MDGKLLFECDMFAFFADPMGRLFLDVTVKEKVFIFMPTMKAGSNLLSFSFFLLDQALSDTFLVVILAGKWNAVLNPDFDYSGDRNNINISSYKKVFHEFIVNSIWLINSKMNDRSRQRKLSFGVTFRQHQPSFRRINLGLLSCPRFQSVV